MPAGVTTAVVIAAESGGSSSGGGNFLVTPSVGLMIWTLIAFFVTLFILRKFAFPRIAEGLDKRRKAIEDSIEASERARREADQLLEEYRERLREAREQAEEIVGRARRAGETLEAEAKEESKKLREEMMADTRREIERETRRAIDEIRREVADLTVAATEKVIRKSLDDDEHRRLIDEAVDEFDFSALADEGSNGGGK